jgi:hypothetical protein
VERAEKGQPGAFDKLSDTELDALFVAEYERIKALPAPAGNVDSGASYMPAVSPSP